MKEEIRTVVYDEELHVEAYRFEGIVQAFPHHFHEYYVIGLVERGERRLFCRGREHEIRAGDILIFHPGDSHACAQSDDKTLDYRALNLDREVMQRLAEEVTGKGEPPGFSANVIRDGELAGYLRVLHEGILNGAERFEKEEALFLFFTALLRNYGRPFACVLPECREEIEKACAFMEEHLADPMDLSQLCRHVVLSKSTLIRAFTKEKGMRPYRYFESIRIGEAKRLLEQGCKTYEEFQEKMTEVSEMELNYFGVAICGPKKKVNKLTGSMPLLR